ncbi:GNAT family N-acetyltransferase [Thalassobius sp. Cn5-15]|uniref:GNAT family N-acetyltransferase n=1 Tax=Thalassobius sp. Cn5-15 TaxID=2917763 RepID=UPI001EF3D26D|nr:GNAT family N-acetyltransferase [Thalassobius sp. Cn5-15]MCG7493616.1 GNAT family N-acetyltransferase [Thalassobius sp. Cn5-15]
MTTEVYPDALAQTHARAFTDQRPWSAVEIADLLSSRHVFLIGDTTSFALGRVIAGEAELLTLATDPDAQGGGLGRATLATYHATAQARGAATAFLEVAETNIAAIRLYETAGYTRAALRPDYYRMQKGQRVAAIIMNRIL